MQLQSRCHKQKTEREMKDLLKPNRIEWNETTFIDKDILVIVELDLIYSAFFSVSKKF